MRLLLVTPFLNTKGGMERVVLKIAEEFKARVFCLDHDPERTFSGFEDIEMEVAPPSIARKFPIGRRVAGAIDAGLRLYTKKFDDYDLINAHQTPAEWVRHRNSPVLWYCYSPNREAYDLYKWRMEKRNPLSKAVFWGSIEAFKHIESSIVPKIEYIFTSCENPRERIKKYLKRDSEVLHPGVEHERFHCRDYEPFFFYPSRIVPEKDIAYAIEAFKLFKKRAEISSKPGTRDWRLKIAGALSDRPEHKRYFEHLKSLCDDSISIETDIDDERLIDLYSRCTATLYSPINEDYGLVPLEGMASGKPCIAKDEGGPKETIIDGQDGFLVSSTEQMAKSMLLLAGDPELAARMGEAGREKVKRDFCWERFLKRFGEKAKELAETP